MQTITVYLLRIFLHYIADAYVYKSIRRVREWMHAINIIINTRVTINVLYIYTYANYKLISFKVLDHGIICTMTVI